MNEENATRQVREEATDDEIQILIDSHEKGTAMFLRADTFYLMAKELQDRRNSELETRLVRCIEEAARILDSGERQALSKALELLRSASSPLRGGLSD